MPQLCSPIDQVPTLCCIEDDSGPTEYKNQGEEDSREVEEDEKQCR